jgi:hypothetical protein
MQYLASERIAGKKNGCGPIAFLLPSSSMPPLAKTKMMNLMLVDKGGKTSPILLNQ